MTRDQLAGLADAGWSSDAPSGDSCVGIVVMVHSLSGMLAELPHPMAMTKSFLPQEPTQGVCHSVSHGNDLGLYSDDRLEGICGMVSAAVDLCSGLESYKGFVSQDQISDITGQGEGHQMTILRNTGASQSLLLTHVATVSAESEMDAKALIQGVAGAYVPVPLRRVNLKSSLVTGVGTVGWSPRCQLRTFIFCWEKIWWVTGWMSHQE